MEFKDPGFFGLIAIRFKQWLIAKLTGTTPLIWTSKGNLPEASLQRFEQWTETEQATTFTEVYMTHDGEVVKSSPHVRLKAPPAVGVDQASI